MVYVETNPCSEMTWSFSNNSLYIERMWGSFNENQCQSKRFVISYNHLVDMSSGENEEMLEQHTLATRAERSCWPKVEEQGAKGHLPLLQQHSSHYHLIKSKIDERNETLYSEFEYNEGKPLLFIHL